MSEQTHLTEYTPYEQPYCDEQDCCSRAVVLMRWGGEWFPLCQLHATANAALEPPEETRRLQQEVTGVNREQATQAVSRLACERPKRLDRVDVVDLDVDGREP